MATTVNPQMPPTPSQQGRAVSATASPADAAKNVRNRLSAVTNGTQPNPNQIPPERRKRQRVEQQNNTMVAPKRFAEPETNFFESISKRLGGKNTLRSLITKTLLFFVLLLILTVTKLFFDQARYKKDAISGFSSELTTLAQNATHSLDNQIHWIDNAIAIQAPPRQTVNFIMRDENVVGVAIIDAAGKIIAASEGAGPTLAGLSRSQVPQNGVQINSLISNNGTPTPVITKRNGDLFLTVALQTKSLVGSNNLNSAVVLSNGKVIDGSAALGRVGAQAFYNVTPNKLADLTKGNSAPKVFSHKSEGEKTWLGATRLAEGSYLTLIAAQPRGLAPNLKQNLFLFTLLFLGMAWLIWSLMSQLMKTIDSVRAQKGADEISRQRYRAAIDGSRGGVWEIDFDNNTTYLSQSLAKLFGMAEKETTLTFPQFLDLFAQADREKLYNTIRRSHVSGEFDIELGAAHLPLFIACRGRPSMRGSDNAKLIIGVALDITQMRGTQARLQAAEARLFDALRSMNDSFVIWDQMGRLVLWNNKFEDFFGFQPGNLQQGMEHALVEYHANKVIENQMALTDGSGQEIELKDGRWVRYVETSTHDGSRVSIGTEVTTIRSREYQLQTNQDALERTINILRKSQVRIVELAENYEQEKIRAEDANQSKTEFLANMSHELRTPLNAINGFSDIMKKELFGPLGDPRYKEYVNDILFSGQHLLSLINDILDMSKIEAGKMNLNTEAMNINDIIQQVVRIVRGRADENRLKLIYRQTDVPEIEADPRAVKQILLNLTTNAIKFTPEGGVVTVTVEPKSAGLIVHVKDTGIGISQENIERLTQPFEQIDSQHSRQHEGTGLGLALSKSMVQLHGGNFSISSVVGEGTTVTFTLPIRPLEQKAKEDDNKVGSEISRLAQDIAEVLSEGEKGFVSGQAASAPVPQLPAVAIPSTPQTQTAPTAPPQYAPAEYQPAAASYDTASTPPMPAPTMINNG